MGWKTKRIIFESALSPTTVGQRRLRLPGTVHLFVLVPAVAQAPRHHFELPSCSYRDSYVPLGTKQSGLEQMTVDNESGNPDSRASLRQIGRCMRQPCDRNSTWKWGRGLLLAGNILQALVDCQNDDSSQNRRHICNRLR